MFTENPGIFVFGLIAAIGGGWLGAAIGGNYAFALVGFAVMVSFGILAGTGSTAGFDYIAFGPFMGPHIAFAGGVAAAAYAYKKGYIPSGKDVSEPLARLGRPSVMWVGAAFGVGGYLLQLLVSQIPFFGVRTDSVAFVVVVLAIVARLMFGGGRLLNRETMTQTKGLMARIAPGEHGRWLQYQERPSQYLSMGAAFGVAAGGLSITVAQYFPAAAAVAQTLGFGFSAIVILFLILGHGMPVQHHVTITAGLAAVLFMPILAGSGFEWGATMTSSLWMAAAGALAIAALFGMFAAFLAEFQAALFYYRGTTHIDPPAMAIWIGNTTAVLLATALGG